MYNSKPIVFNGIRLPIVFGQRCSCDSYRNPDKKFVTRHDSYRIPIVSYDRAGGGMGSRARESKPLKNSALNFKVTFVIFVINDDLSPSFKNA